MKNPELMYVCKEYYVARNWGISSAMTFIEKIENKFPMISFEKID